MSEFNLIEHLPYLGLFIILILGGLGFPFPEGVTLIIGGFLSSSHLVDIFLILPIAFCGILIGDILSYFIGKKYGRALIEWRMFRKLLSQDKLSLLEKKFEQSGGFFIFIGGRLISGIFLIAGIMKMPFSKLFLYDILSAISAVIIWGGIGYIGGNSLQIIQKDITRIEHLAVIVLICFLVIYLFIKYFRTRGIR